jgi:hypothetical protein
MKKKEGKTKEVRVFWSEDERIRWYELLEEEAKPRLNGKLGVFAEVAVAAMKRMDRKRAMVAPLVKDAGEVVKRLRREAEASKFQQPKVEEMDRSPAVEASNEPEIAIEDAYEPMVAQSWMEQVGEGLAQVLVHAIVTATESPSVRRAIRSMVQVATDPNFKPEIDNTVVWTPPSPLGPKLPRVLVAGFWKIGPVEKLSHDFGRHLDLRFWRTDESLNQLKQDARSAETIVLVAGTSNHTVRQICMAAKKNLITIPLAGGTSMVARTLKQMIENTRRAH